MKKYKSKSVQADIEWDEERRKSGVCDIPKPKYWIGDIVVCRRDLEMSYGIDVEVEQHKIIEASLYNFDCKSVHWAYKVDDSRFEELTEKDILNKKK